MMDIHTATETAYKNGYEKGKADAAREIFAEIKRLGFVGGFDRKMRNLVVVRATDFEALEKKHTEDVTDTNVGSKDSEDQK